MGWPRSDLPVPFALCPANLTERGWLVRTSGFLSGTCRYSSPKTGEEVSKSAAVGTIDCLAELIGESALGAGGCRRFGGHSLRTGGASMLASRGVGPARIQAMGRWRSPMVLHYATAALGTGLAALVVCHMPVSYTHLTLPTILLV